MRWIAPEAIAGLTSADAGETRRFIAPESDSRISPIGGGQSGYDSVANGSPQNRKNETRESL
jgi:hypothetical protein